MKPENIREHMSVVRNLDMVVKATGESLKVIRSDENLECVRIYQGEGQYDFSYYGLL